MEGEGGGERMCEASETRQEGGRGELKGKCKKYITNLSPLVLPSPYTHTLQSQKSQRGGRDLIRLSAVHHIHTENLQSSVVGGMGMPVEKRGAEGEMKLN